MPEFRATVRETIDDFPRSDAIGPLGIRDRRTFGSLADARAACEADNAARFGKLAPALVWSFERGAHTGRWPAEDAHDDSAVWRIREVR